MGQSASHGCCSKSEQTEHEHVTAEALSASSKPQSLDFGILPEPSAILPEPAPYIGDGCGEVSVDLTQSAGRELLRGISLRKTLQSRGALWRYKPSELEPPEREKLYSYSKPVRRLDMFISHAWATPGRWKFLALLLQSGWQTMLAAWGLLTAVTFGLCFLDVLPLNGTIQATVSGAEGEMRVGTWLILAGWTSAIGGLAISPYIPFCASDTCFVDVACVHQTDDLLMQKGIQNIGGFLAASGELRVLWSVPYLSRLWCIFELAAYRKVNPTGKIVLSPLFIETITLQIFIWLEVMTSLFWYTRVAREGRLVPTGWLLASLAGTSWLAVPLVHSLRHSYRSKKVLISSLDGFDVMSVECTNASDRDRIHAAIRNWYGSLNAFSDYVRGPFRRDILEPIQTAGSIPFGYICLLAVPLFNMCLEGVLANTKHGAPFHSTAAYFLSVQVGLCLLWVPALLVLLVFICERGAEMPSSRCRHLLETLAIVVSLWLLFSIGVIAAVSAHQRGFGFVLLWLAASLLFAGLTWRYCWRWQGYNAFNAPRVQSTQIWSI